MTKTPSTTSPHSRAFTLLELVLVMALIAVIVGIVVPSMSRFGRARQLGHAANQMIALSQWARTQSVNRGVSFRLNFDQSNRQYWLTMQNGPTFENMTQSQNGAPATTTYNALGEDWGKVFTAPEGVNFVCNMTPQTDGTYVEFRPSGRCDPGTVRFTDANGDTIEVGCLSATELFHVLNDDEQQQEQAQLPQPSSQTR